MQFQFLINKGFNPSAEINDNYYTLYQLNCPPLLCFNKLLIDFLLIQSSNDIDLYQDCHEVIGWQ